MPDVLLATCARLPGGDEDGDLLLAALGRAGVEARWVAWTDWADLDSTDTRRLTVLRSTWDYMPRRAQFLDWARSVPRLVNAADVVGWNTDKTYLADLAAAGVPTVATTFVGPGQELQVPDAAEFVVKPSVGAGSRGAGRFGAGDFDAAREHLSALHAAGRTALVQPYLDEVDVAGETALVYLDGRFSHAVRKGAMLPAGTAHPVDARELFVAEQISACVPDPAELAVGTAALDAIRARFGADQLYARVDLLPSPHGPVVVELELTEPSLFLGGSARVNGVGTEPADRLAAAIAARA